MTTRKTLKDFLTNVKGIPQDKIGFNINSNGSLIEEGNDLGEETLSKETLIGFDEPTKGFLGDYLSFITSKNSQQIKQGNFKAISSTRGVYPHSNPDESSEPFVKQGTKEAGLMSQYSNSEYFEGEVHSIIDKIGIEDNNPLKGIEGQDVSKTNTLVNNPEGEDNAIIQASQNVLIRNNRFSPTAKKKVFNPQGISSEDFDAGLNEHGTFQLQNDFGDFDHSKFITNIDSLKNIGKSLLLKAGGWDISNNVGDSINPSEFDIDNANSVISINGINKVNIENLSAKNSFGFPSDSEGNSARQGRGNSTEKRIDQFATYFNHDMHHFGKGYKKVKTQAAIALIAIKKSLQLVFSQLENIGIKSRKINGNALEDMFVGSTDVKVKGKYKPDIYHNVDFLKKKLFIKTVHSYFDCVDVGIRAIFSSNSKLLDPSITLDSSKFLKSDAYFWFSIFSSVLKRSQGMMTSTFAEEGGDFLENSVMLVEKIKNNALIRFMNTLATIGDVHLVSQNGKDSNDKQINIRNVDSLPNLPSTRVMKSKSGIYNKRNLSFSGRNLPSAYILPLNVIGASIDMNTISKGTNPSRGMLGSSLADKTYTAVGLQGSYNRIPIEVVREMENRFEAEYLPFYITDLRTNEVIAFHGFVTSLTDQISPSFNESTGYGRLDPIKTYGKTTRTVSVGFKLISTNPQDFDEMWYKINKLVTLFYPQYTDGDTIRKSNSPFDKPMLNSATSAVFKQPFSQVIGATPVVRMRIGDVIKSNYSKFNLSRIFGAGDLGTNLRPSVEGNNGVSQILDTVSAVTNLSGIGVNIPGVGRLNFRDALLNIFSLKYGSPMGKASLTNTGAKQLNNTFLKSDIVNTAADQITSQVIANQAEGLINGFVNPIVINDIVNKTIDPAVTASPTNESKYGYRIGDQAFLRVTPEKHYIDNKGNKYNFNRNILCKILDRNVKTEEVFNSNANKNSYQYEYYTEYEVEVNDPLLGNIVGSVFKVVHSDILPDYSDIYEQTYGRQISKGDQGVGEWISKASKSSQSEDKTLVAKMANNAFNTAINGPEAFMSSFYNPVTRAFETNMGRGLAGTLGGVNFNWMSDDYPWETSFNSRAPIGVDITLTLSVIHDIPPGLDHSGYNRAPLYNVGNIMKEVSGDPNNELQEAEDSFNEQEAQIQSRLK
jgi:hypothetical protein